MYQKPSRSTEYESPEAAMCLACRSPNPHARHQHYLVLAAAVGSTAVGSTAVEEHVYQDLLDRYKGDRDRAARCARDTAGWVQGQITAFQDLKDAQTGAPLGWWDARQQYLRAIQVTYAAIEARGRQAVQAKADAARGFVPRVPPRQREPAVFLEEPTVDESAQWEAAMALVGDAKDFSDYSIEPDEA